FRSVGSVNSRYHTPTVSLIIQAIWASLLTLSGTYSELLDYVIFAAVLFYMLTIRGVFRLRRTRPEAPRPYRAWGYPLIPAVYIVFAGFVEWALLTHKALRSITGLCIVALGIPVYYLWRRGTPARSKRRASRRADFRSNRDVQSAGNEDAGYDSAGGRRAGRNLPA